MVRSRPVFTSLVALLVTLSLAACGGGGGGAPPLAAPVIAAHPASRTVNVGETASFTVGVTGTGLTYQWQLGVEDLPGATGAVYTTPATTLDDSGRTYRVVVTNAAGQATSNGATLTVNPVITPVRAVPWVETIGNGGIALKANGTVWSWGDGSFGALGRGSLASSLSPAQVRDASGTNVLDRIVKISAGPGHVLALRDDGTVWAWGTSTLLGATDSPELASQALLPVQVAGVGGVGVLSNVVDVSAGVFVSAAVLGDGTVVAWGANSRGGVGVGSEAGGVFTPVDVYFPMPVPGVTGVVEVSAGYQRVLARRADGAILSWGSNPNGELGRVTADTSTVGTVGGISSAVRVVAGYESSLAILADGSARIWGLHGYDGTVGAGTGATCATTASSTPTAIPRPAGTGSSFSAAVPTFPASLFAHDGQLYLTGQFLQDVASGTCSRGLELVPGATDVAGVSRGWSYHALTWGRDGRVRGLGINESGQLGLGHTDPVTGLHEIPDFDLYGAAPAVTEVLFADFDTALPPQVAVGTGADRVAVEGFGGLGPAAAPFNGNFLRSPTGNTITVSVSGLPAHRTIGLAFLFAAIDSLDGAGSFPAGDYFKITLDGQTIFREAFSNALPSQVQTYLSPPGVELARRVDLGFAGPGGFFTDSAYDLGADPRFQQIPHTASTAEFTFQIEGAGIQALSDESWAMDNLRVTVGP